MTYETILRVTLNRFTRVAAALALAGCNFSPSVSQNGTLDDGGMLPDAPVDDGGNPLPDGFVPDVDGGLPCTDFAFKGRFFDACQIGKPPGTTEIHLTEQGVAPDYVYNTNGGGLLLSNGATVSPQPEKLDVGGYHIIFVERLLVDSGVSLRVEGTAPLLVVAYDRVRIDGDIDLSSYIDIDVDGFAVVNDGGDPTFHYGAGSNSDCGDLAAEQGQQCNQHAGAGGGGGGFGAPGSRGGAASTGHACELPLPPIQPGGAGGGALANTPTQLIGGCAGGDGRENDEGDGESPSGGPGGGAIHLMARNSITVTATGSIHVGGSGGEGGSGNRESGGGGGSGGFIGLEAPTVTLDSAAKLATNGGGGGGGTDGGIAYPGENAINDDAQADGGAESGNGGKGGKGGYGDLGISQQGQVVVPSDRGGGGGGGGVGFIAIFADTFDDNGGNLSGRVESAQLVAN